MPGEKKRGKGEASQLKKVRSTILLRGDISGSHERRKNADRSRNGWMLVARREKGGLAGRKRKKCRGATKNPARNNSRKIIWCPKGEKSPRAVKRRRSRWCSLRSRQGEACTPCERRGEGGGKGGKGAGRFGSTQHLLARAFFA